MRSQVTANICKDLSKQMTKACEASGLTQVQLIILAVDRIYCSHRMKSHYIKNMDQSADRVRISYRIPGMTSAQLRKLSTVFESSMTDALMLAIFNLLATDDWRVQ